MLNKKRKVNGEMQRIVFILCIILFWGCGPEEPVADGVIPVLMEVGGEPSWSSKDVIAVGFGNSIYYCDPDGRNLKKITPTPELEVYDLDWSPDGETIVLEGIDMGVSGSKLYKIDFPEPEATLFVGEEAGDPSWSPDGKYIAYSRVTGYKSSIVIVPAEGGEPRELTAPGCAVSPEWAPNSEDVVYAEYPPGDEFLVSTVNIKTRRTKFITEGLDPAWHPFGRWLAVVRKQGEDFNIYLIDPFNGGAIRVVQTPPGLPDSMARTPTWSPKGDWLAFHGIRWNYGIYKIQVPN